MRQERLRSLLQVEAANFMFNLRQSMELNEMIGIDEVLLTPDLKQANIWISFTPHPSEGRAKILWNLMHRSLPKLKTWLAERLEMRKIPTINLEFSNPEEEYRLDKIFDELDKR